LFRLQFKTVLPLNFILGPIPLPALERRSSRQAGENIWPAVRPPYAVFRINRPCYAVFSFKIGAKIAKSAVANKFRAIGFFGPTQYIAKLFDDLKMKDMMLLTLVQGYLACHDRFKQFMAEINPSGLALQ